MHAHLHSHYGSKRCTPEQALDWLNDGDTIIVPTGAGEPPSLLHALSAQRTRFRDIKVAQILAMRKYGYFDCDTVQHVRHLALFFGGASRAAGQAGWADFVPAYFSELPSLIERDLVPADVVFSLASPMDEYGNFALSLGADYTMAAILKALSLIHI